MISFIISDWKLLKEAKLYLLVFNLNLARLMWYCKSATKHRQPDILPPNLYNYGGKCGKAMVMDFFVGRRGAVWNWLKDGVVEDHASHLLNEKCSDTTVFN